MAILVPFRNRHEHLPILLRHLVPVLQDQRLQFAFYLIEQVWTPTLSLTGILSPTESGSLPVCGFHFPFWVWYTAAQKTPTNSSFHLFQGGTEPFNRAMLFNVGYKEAMKDLDWDCLIFHDVDHLMENDRNYYGCTNMPRHFAVKLDKYYYMWVVVL